MIKNFITKVKVEKELRLNPKRWKVLYIPSEEPDLIWGCEIKVLLFGLFWVTHMEYLIYNYKNRT